MIVAELAALLGLEIDESKWDKGHELVESLHHALEAYVGVEAVAKLKEMVEGTVHAAVEAKHLAERLNTSTEAIQELQYAADVTGASAESLQQGMQRLALGMEHARKTGSGPLVDALNQLHIPIANLRKEKLDQNLEEIANAFKNAGPNVNKTAVAMELFGRNAGPRLIPLLNKGGEGIKQLREEAQKLGVVIDEKGIEKAEEFEIAQKRLGATLVGLRNTAVQALLPALQEMLEGLTKWIAANREAIASTLEAVIRGVAEAFETLGHVVSVVTKFVQDHRDAVLDVLTVLTVAITAFAVKATIAWFAAMGPIALMAAAIAGVILAVRRFGAIASILAIIFGGPVLAAVGAVTLIVTKLGIGLDDIADFVEAAGEAIVHALSAAFDWLKDKLDWVLAQYERVKKFIQGDEEKFANETYVGSIVKQFRDGVKTESGVPAGALQQAQAFSSNTTTIGDTHITIHAEGMTAEEVQRLASDAAANHIQDKIRSAYTSLGGGKPGGG